ncbi:MAG: hypothetical protein ACAF41_16560 [Leptolyngbya sp. BL-A-14]
MESGSQSVNSPDRSRNWAADVFGFVIALVTLIAPLAVIAYYSGESSSLPSVGYTQSGANSR